jgi:sterol-4alpha-carboxylate 3-dehydrogenase (decarboxylating)
MSSSHESYLVTGGCGLLGQHIVKQLLARNPQAPVAVFDLVRGEVDERVRVFIGDITDREAVEAVVKEVSHTFGSCSRLQSRCQLLEYALSAT